jgi:hypothetical protein
MWEAGWNAVAAALRQIEGVEPLPCDGHGHHLEGFAACLHVRIGLPSPRREEMLGRLASLVRRQHFVLASLVERPDLYNLTYRPGRRGADLAAAGSALAALLLEPTAWGDAQAPDRRGQA